MPQIDGVPIGNTVAQKSYRGALFTDEGFWSPRTAIILDKYHGICSKHKSNGIFTSKAGLGGLIAHYIKDIYALIYDVFLSEEELNAKIDAALAKYIHDSNANKYIENILNTKVKLRATYMHFVFSYGHTTTQAVEGFNNRLKGYGDLNKYLSVANLITFHNLVDPRARNQYFESIKRLVKLRKEDERWSQYYQYHLY